MLFSMAILFQKLEFCFLDLEGVDTVEKQIFIACQKAGIDPIKEKISNL